MGFDPTGEFFVIGGPENIVKSYDLNEAEAESEEKNIRPLELKNHEDAVSSLSFSWNNLYSADASGNICSWNLKEGTNSIEPLVMAEKHRYSVYQMKFLPGTKEVIIGDEFDLYYWDYSIIPPRLLKIERRKGSLITMVAKVDPFTENPPSIIERILQKNELGCIAFNRYWVIAGVPHSNKNPNVTVFSAEQGTILTNIDVLSKTKGEWINAKLSSDGRWLMIGFWENEAFVPVSDWKTGYLLNLEKNIGEALPVTLVGSAVMSQCEISPDSKSLVIGYKDGSLRQWDISGRTVNSKTPKVLFGHGTRVTAIIISSDSHWLYTGSKDGVVKKWDLSDLSPVYEEFFGHDVRVEQLALSEDGNVLGAGGGNIAAIWSLNPDVLIKKAEKVGGRSFTIEEKQQFLESPEF